MLKKLPMTDSMCWQLSIILLNSALTAQCPVSYPIAKKQIKNSSGFFLWNEILQ